MAKKTRQKPAPKDADMQRGIGRAFEIIQQIIADPKKYDQEAIVIAPDHVAEVFTPERARIYMVMRERGSIESISALAKLLKRDVSRVSRDVDYLEGFGLVHRERAGKSKRVVADEKPILIV